MERTTVPPKLSTFLIQVDNVSKISLRRFREEEVLQSMRQPELFEPHRNRLVYVGAHQSYFQTFQEETVNEEHGLQGRSARQIKVVYHLGFLKLFLDLHLNTDRIARWSYLKHFKLSNQQAS